MEEVIVKKPERDRKELEEVERVHDLLVEDLGELRHGEVQHVVI
jgi:hypothetical protein